MTELILPPSYPGYCRDSCGKAYLAPPRRGYTDIPVLPFLVGQPWDEVALCYVHGLRPTSIRVTTGYETLDARTWRVTVHVDTSNVITKISQEVEVGLADGIKHGHDLSMRLLARKQAEMETPVCPKCAKDRG